MPISLNQREVEVLANRCIDCGVYPFLSSNLELLKSILDKQSNKFYNIDFLKTRAFMALQDLHIEDTDEYNHIYYIINSIRWCGYTK